MCGIEQPKTEHVRIFDTTLRDGEQAPGFSLTVLQKLRMARMLAAMRVDIVEAGFAAASPGDADAVYRIASEIEGPVICSLARAQSQDILAAARALKPAASRRLHIFLATSPIHRTAKLKMTTDQVLRAIRDSIGLAREHFDDVEFSPEDAIRTERDFLVEALETAIEAGAATVNVPDTVGYTTPGEISDLFSYLHRTVTRGRDVVLSAHCHDDLGMAVANSLLAVQAGARQVECTVNGIGERAGNCSLEEIVMALRTRSDWLGVTSEVDATRFCAASKLLSDMTGNPVPRNKAVVGRNAFAHEAGIHQHGVLSDRTTYEIMKPEDVGMSRSHLVLGKHSGKHAIRHRAAALGVHLGENQLGAVFDEFKRLADELGEVDDAQLLALIAGADGQERPPWRVHRLEMRIGHGGRGEPFAVVDVEDANLGWHTEVARGATPTEAALEALKKAVGVRFEIMEFESRQVLLDDGPMYKARMAVRVGQTSYTATVNHEDSMTAGTEALATALNLAAWEYPGKFRLQTEMVYTG